MRLQITKYMRLMMACCLLCVATGMQAQKKGELPYEDKLIVGKLDNGLTYYIYPNANPKGEAVYRLFVKAGSVLDNSRGHRSLILTSLAMAPRDNFLKIHS